MALEYWAGGLISILMLFYLIYALLRPERF
jgi:K+-transporting ATPase KdpF subunit